jgi:hypothetical protein
MAKYDEAVLKRIQSRWGSFKEETKMSQSTAGKAMGMNQSAFGQYLRGAIPLNSDFIAKFEKLTGEEIVGVKTGDDVAVVTLQVRATLSGRTLEKRRQAVTSVLAQKDSFLVEVDYRSHFLPYGSFLVVSESDEIKAGSMVVYRQEYDRYVYGELSSTEDGWFVTEPHFFGARSHAVDETNEIFRVAGVYFPPNKGAVLKTP